MNLSQITLKIVNITTVYVQGAQLLHTTMCWLEYGLQTIQKIAIKIEEENGRKLIISTKNNPYPLTHIL